jgi:hypothetical protein
MKSKCVTKDLSVIEGSGNVFAEWGLLNLCLADAP